MPWRSVRNPAKALFAASLLSAVTTGGAPAAEPAARALAQQVYERPDGRDVATRGRMTLRSYKGRAERVRQFYQYRLDGESGESWNLIRFTAPVNIADTGLLVHNQAAGISDQWLYLPAAQRERRVSGANRGGRFVQSDLYFEDLENRRPDQDRHRLLGEERVAGVALTRLESIPVDPSGSVYTKRISWIDPDTLVPMRVDFFQGGEQPVKRFEAKRVARVQSYWTVMDSVMTSLESGHETRMEVEAIRYDQNLPDRLFTTRALSDPALERPFRP